MPNGLSGGKYKADTVEKGEFAGIRSLIGLVPGCGGFIKAVSRIQS